MPRVPLIKFPKRHPKVPSVPSPADQYASLMSRLVLTEPVIPLLWNHATAFHVAPANLHEHEDDKEGAKSEAPLSSGEIKNYRFRSDVPSPPSHTAVGGAASQLPKRTPLSEEEIEAIMLGGSF